MTDSDTLCPPHRRLDGLGIDLPDLGPPAYSYDPVSVHGSLLAVSGQISRDDQGVRCGVVGEGATVADAVAAARISTLNLLGRINESVGLSAVVGVPKLTVWVASSKEFTDQPAVAETCSKLLLSVLGEAGRHARTALPVHVLPKRALVELDALVAISRPDHAQWCESCRPALQVDQGL
ncbi:RidA family protein [Tsukamurella tyrosinosolvens]|uniref:RidA family protein n=1 Tax=Tsukamurella tyrosinosolvens TaxID=57704 RepID=UPI000C7F6D0E|nr:RidA family protein [Tsukamurella tyrosinosolvens]AUN41867.1 hypothetical protein ASU32_19215 [Tsukamurella tyrosinosolvens]